MARLNIKRQTQPGKNSTLYKIHKEGNPLRLLTAGCNTTVENLSRFIEKIYAPLTKTNNIDARIKDTEHLLQIIDKNSNGLPNDSIFVSFHIVNLFPNTDNIKGIEAVKVALQKRS